MENASKIRYSEDLPDELKQQLAHHGKRRRSASWHSTILMLLHEEGDLNLNDILIGVYRSKKKVLNRSSAKGHMNHLISEGLVERPRRGVYQLTSDGITKCKAAIAAAATKPKLA